MSTKKIDIQGHRGARGLMPENTIPAFIKALELGVTTLELDLAVTKDMELLVSHEPYMNSLYALDTLGNEILKTEELKHNIYKMSYEEVKRYDVGSKFFDRFPDQVKMKVEKPLLIDLINTVNEYVEAVKIPAPYYNIEIKSDPIGDSIYHPDPAEFSNLVYDFIIQNMDTSRLNVQSFDFRILKYFKANYPAIRLAVLVENTASIEDNLKELGFVPEIYSCYHHNLDSQKISYLHSEGMKVIPWTVNEKTDIQRLINWGVDGIISDYPDRVIQLVGN
jgi:glycerophosphoryl diester phosphodiesterase